MFMLRFWCRRLSLKELTGVVSFFEVTDLRFAERASAHPGEGDEQGPRPGRQAIVFLLHRVSSHFL